MFLLGCPVGVRHLPHIAADQVRRAWHRFTGHSARRLHFVYFSCERDFPLIRLSLASLARMPALLDSTVTVVMDSKGVFSAEHQTQLQELFRDIRFLELGNIDWASLDTLRTELRAFGLVAEGADAGDYIVKIDSDVLLFSPDKLLEIASSGKAFVGDGHYSQYRYAQGGMYFIRQDIAMVLANEVDEPELHDTIHSLGKMSEDRVISKLVTRRTNGIWLTRIMLFPDELTKVDFTNSWLRKEFSAIHFVKGKDTMPDYGRKLGIHV